jgi:hypothetical protein
MNMNATTETAPSTENGYKGWANVETYAAYCTILQDRTVHRVIDGMKADIDGDRLYKTFTDFFPGGTDVLDVFDLMEVDWCDMAECFSNN